MALKLAPKELRIAFAKLRVCLVEGLEPDEMCERLGLQWGDVEELRRRYLDHEADIVRHKPTEHTYVEYCLEMRKCIQDLERVTLEYEGGVEDAEGGKDVKGKPKTVNVSGYVGAVRARADIIDRIIKQGQEFGFIERKAESKGYAAGQAIKDLSNADFRQYIFNEINVFNTMQMKFGDRSIMDVEPGPLYAPTANRKFPVHKIKGHARSKVFGGRQLTRGANG